MVAENEFDFRVRRDRQVDFIHVNWSLLCCIGYEKYLEKGKGMVVVAEENFIHEKKAVIAKIRITYLQLKELTDGKLIGEKEQKWLEQYQPDFTLLVGFLRINGEGFDSYRLQGFMPNIPKTIYEQRRPNDGQNANSK